MWTVDKGWILDRLCPVKRNYILLYIISSWEPLNFLNGEMTWADPYFIWIPKRLCDGEGGGAGRSRGPGKETDGGMFAVTWAACCPPHTSHALEEAHQCSALWELCWTKAGWGRRGEVWGGRVSGLCVLVLLTCCLASAVTKLQVSKSKRTLTLVENRPIQLNCSVKSQTSQNSHFAVLWYVHKSSDADGKLILKTTHNSAFEFGTYAEEEGLRSRLQFERHVSGGLFSLTVQRAEVSDSGSYYCHVEEWLLSPNYAWYKLAEEVSGRTEVTVKQPGKDTLGGAAIPG